ncbi:hypothetical protein G5714_010997 [Onychostoma macrolepis]|uniref:Uncharacterized protein n=1 Tax=Onychostoma macrolepis TaxID=369639 RepID=A0A7J6CLP6_9TELE|nr:hypothetical protein G5714_010997 [Onychostoma macrolepis]
MNSTETQEMDRDDEEEVVICANVDVIINDDGRTGVEDSDTKRLHILQNTDRSESTYDNMNSTETQEMDRDDEEEVVICANVDVIINDDGRTGVEDSETKRLRILQNTGSVRSRMYGGAAVCSVDCHHSAKCPAQYINSPNCDQELFS